METDVTASTDPSLTNGIEGRVTPGQNGATLTIESSSRLTFQSDAAAKINAAGAPFTIIRDDTKQLAAYFFDGASMNSLVLNKTSGLAIWPKIRSTFPMYDAPTGSSSYLVCR